LENFGQKNVIAQAYVSTLVKGPVIRSDNSNDPIKLAQNLKECNTTLQHMRYYSEMNNFDNISKIVGRLPFTLQTRWLRYVVSVDWSSKALNPRLMTW